MLSSMPDLGNFTGRGLKTKLICLSSCCLSLLSLYTFGFLHPDVTTLAMKGEWPY